MRRLLLTLAAALALCLGAGAAFVDVPADYWAAGAVDEAAARHITTGFPDGSFRPGEQVSRGQLLAMVLRGTDPGGVDRAAEGTAWWRPYCDAALAQGLLDDGDGYLFAGADMDAPAARQELAVLLLNADAVHNGLSLTGDWAGAAQFADGERTAACRAAASGLLAGYPDGTFRGEAPVTRAEACTAVLRLLAREDWLDEEERQVVYTGPVLIKRAMRPDGGAVLTSVRTGDGTVVQTMTVPVDNFAGFEEQRRQAPALWAEAWGRTACGADSSAFWGEIGYYTYKADGTFAQWTDRAVLHWAADGEKLAAISHRPGRRVWLSGNGAAYQPAGDQVIRFGPDGAVETLLSDRPAHGLCLTAITGAADGGLRVRREEIFGMADCHAWEYAVEDGRLRPLVHGAGTGWSGFTPEEAAAEQARLDALGGGK